MNSAACDPGEAVVGQGAGSSGGRGVLESRSPPRFVLQFI